MLLMMSRVGGNVIGLPDGEAAILWGDSIDSFILGDILSYGYFLIFLIQAISYLVGEAPYIQVFDIH